MAVRRQVSTSLSLPSEPNEPSENLTDYCSFIYGRKQWGKSTLATQYPKSINFMFEPFRKGLKIMQVAPRTFEEAKEYVSLFVEDDRFQNGVFDTVDRFYDMLLLHKCRSMSNGSKTHPSEFGNEGYAIWDLVKAEFEAFFETIREMGKTFVLISHDKVVKYKDRDGAEWNRVEPTCKPAAWKIGQSMCDFVFHVDFFNGERIVTVRDLDNSTLASCNPEVDCFLDPDGAPLRRFRVDNDSKRAFACLQAAFNNELRDYSYVEPKTPLKAKSNGKLPLGKKVS